MMGLMVEDMGDRPPERRLELLAAAHVHERGGEPLVGEPGDPGREFVVGERSLPAEVLEMDVELLVEGTYASRAYELVRDGHALEACEPDPVGEIDARDCHQRSRALRSLQCSERCVTVGRCLVTSLSV
jgi:hypothetical protein